MTHSARPCASSACPLCHAAALAAYPWARYIAGTDALLLDQQLELVSTDQVQTLTLAASVRQGDCVLELTNVLFELFEHEFSLGLLQRGLLVLQPAVLLHADGEPELDDADVDALAEWCEHQQYPQRIPLLNQLLPATIK